MPWAPLRRLVPQNQRRPLQEQAAIALALLAGTQHMIARNEALKTRVRLASIRRGVVHAIALSGPAAAELGAMKEGLFVAMRAAAPVEPTDLRVEVRGTLADEA